MSTRTWAVDEYGIVLKMDDLKRMYEKTFQEDIPDNDWKEDPYGFIEPLRAKIDIGYYGDFTGEAFPIEEDGSDNYDESETYNCEELHYVVIRKYPTLFSGAYECFGEMVKDFQMLLAPYVPNDFDYSKVCHIVGTYFG